MCPDIARTEVPRTRTFDGRKIRKLIQYCIFKLKPPPKVHRKLLQCCCCSHNYDTPEYTVLAYILCGCVLNVKRTVTRSPLVGHRQHFGGKIPTSLSAVFRAALESHRPSRCFRLSQFALLFAVGDVATIAVLHSLFLWVALRERHYNSDTHLGCRA